MNEDPWKHIQENLERQSSVSEDRAEFSVAALRKALNAEHAPLLVLLESNASDTTEQGSILFQGKGTHEDVEFKAALREAVADSLSAKPKILYNPGSGTHVSLAELCADCRTIFTDINGDVHHAFVQHNIDNPDNEYEFFREDMHDFVLPDGELADVTLIFNAGYMTQSELNRIVSDGGIVIVNDWHGAATYMSANCPNYEQVKMVRYKNQSLDLFVFKRINAESIS